MNKNRLILLGLVVVVVIGAVYFASNRPVLAEDISLTVFEQDGQSTGVGAVRVPFVRDGNKQVLDIFVDGVSVVEDAPAVPDKARGMSYSFEFDSQGQETHTVKVVMGKETVEKTLTAQKRDAGSLLDLASVTDPENATKGIAKVYAQEEEVIEITQEGIPDLPQKPGECGPTVSANGIIGLTNKHGSDEQKEKVKNPQALIDELKIDMNWTAQNGTPPDSIVSGKNAWAARNGFPIRTEKLGDANGLTSLDVIKDALSSGAAVELRVAFADGEGKPAGGHIVTVTGFHQGFGQTYLEVNDPVSPDGADMYEIRGNVLSNYGYFNGHTVLSWVIVERWGSAPEENSGTSTQTDSNEQTQGLPQVEVIEYQGKYIPVSQLRVGAVHPPHEAGAGCPQEHWHADATVTALDGTKFDDPDPGACGFGILSLHPIISVDDTRGNADIEVRGLEGLK